MSVFLADGNLLVALVVQDHVNHDMTLDWFEAAEPDLATCPITEGTCLRFLIREGRRATDASAVLDALRVQPWHRFWPDAIPYEAGHLRGHRPPPGHRRLPSCSPATTRVVWLTLDRGLAALHGDAALLVSA